MVQLPLAIVHLNRCAILTQGRQFFLRIHNVEGSGLFQPVLHCVGNTTAHGAAGINLMNGGVVQFPQCRKQTGGQGVDIGFPSISKIDLSLQRVAATGLLMRVSELDITVPDNSEASFERQGRMYGQIMKLLEAY